MTATKLLVSGESCGCPIICQTKEPPREDEAIASFEHMERYTTTTPKPRVLVFTDGGAPGPAHRKRLDQILATHRAQLRCAVVTDSTFARGVMHALHRFYPIFKAFSPKEIEEALRYLDVPTQSFEEVKRRVEELKASLAG